MRGEVHVHDGFGVGDQPRGRDEHGCRPHVLLDGGGQLVEAHVIGDIAGIEARLAACLVDELGAGLAGFLALVEDGDGIAVLGEAARGRLADAAGASGDDGELLGWHEWRFPRVCVWWVGPNLVRNATASSRREEGCGRRVSDPEGADTFASVFIHHA